MSEDALYSNTYHDGTIDSSRDTISRDTKIDASIWLDGEDDNDVEYESNGRHYNYKTDYTNFSSNKYSWKKCSIVFETPVYKGLSSFLNQMCDDNLVGEFVTLNFDAIKKRDQELFQRLTWDISGTNKKMRNYIYKWKVYTTV